MPSSIISHQAPCGRSMHFPQLLRTFEVSQQLLIFLFFPFYIIDDATGVHHDEAITKAQCIAHIVSNHKSC